MADKRPQERMVEVATCSSPYEASVVQAMLAEADIPFITDEMTSQFAFTAGPAAASSVRVAESDVERAQEILSPDQEQFEEVTETPEERQADLHARRDRRYKIARFLLVSTGIVYLATAVFALAVALADAVVHVAVGAVLISVVAWSYRAPRQAFLMSFFVIAGAAVLGMLMDRPFLIGPGLMVLFASYYAHDAAKQVEQAALSREHTRVSG